jgi:nucleoside-diphosphate-sugar epimerase
MSKVLVLGATGFIGTKSYLCLPNTLGFAIATAFSRRGYIVYGLTRSEEKAKELSKNEGTLKLCKVEK